MSLGVFYVIRNTPRQRSFRLTLRKVCYFVAGSTYQPYQEFGIIERNERGGYQWVC